LRPCWVAESEPENPRGCEEIIVERKSRAVCDEETRELRKRNHNPPEVPVHISRNAYAPRIRYYLLQIAHYDVDCVTPFNLKQNQPVPGGALFPNPPRLIAETGDHVKPGIGPIIKGVHLAQILGRRRVEEFEFDMKSLRRSRASGAFEVMADSHHKCAFASGVRLSVGPPVSSASAGQDVVQNFPGAKSYHSDAWIGPLRETMSRDPTDWGANLVTDANELRVGTSVEENLVIRGVTT
jgi:hypothetical protein